MIQVPARVVVAGATVGAVAAALLVPGVALADPASWWNQPPIINQDTTLSVDVNGDDFDDVVAFHDDGAQHASVWVWLSDGAGGFGGPIVAWTSDPDEDWDLDQLRFVGGDFTGDGRADLAVVRSLGEPEDRELFVLRSGFESGHTEFLPPVAIPGPVPSAGDLDGSHLVAGDFNGDGIDDVAAWGRTREVPYPRHLSYVWSVYLGTASVAVLAAPSLWWFREVRRFTPLQQVVVGDFDGDGRDDLAVVRGNPSAKVHRFHSTGGGFTYEWLEDWNTQDRPELDFWAVSDARTVAGDFTGDGRTDLAMFYDYGSQDTGLWLSTAGTDGRLGGLELVWRTGPWEWNVAASKFVGGDLDHDGLDDVVAFYRYFDTDTALLTRLTGGGGIPLSFTTSWRPGQGIFDDIEPV